MMWVLQVPVTPALGEEQVVTLPLEGLADFTSALSMEEIKQRLRAADPALPPEPAAAHAERIWRYLRGLQPEDIIVVSLKASSRIAFADLTQRPYYEDGQYKVRLRWRTVTAPGRLLRAQATLLAAHGEPLRPITAPALRKRIQQRLRLPGMRFARWSWIMGALFVLRVIYLAIRQWQVTRYGG